MVESYRLIGYANRTMADEDFRNDGADAGELCAGAELTVAYEVVLTDEGRRREGDEPWLTCAVRYQPAGERAGEAPAEQRFAVGRESWSAEPGDDWSLAAAVIEFGMLVRGSEFVGTATADGAAALAENSRERAGRHRPHRPPRAGRSHPPSIPQCRRLRWRRCC